MKKTKNNTMCHASVVMEPDLLRKIKAQANSEYRTVSTWIRLLILEKLKLLEKKGEAVA